MAAIFGEGKIFWKLQILHSLDTLWVENFDEIALSRTVKEIEANLCFAIFGKNSKIQNGRHFWGGEIFLKNAKSTMIRYPVGWAILIKIARPHRVYRRNANLCFAIFGKKFSPPKLAAIFGDFQIFAKIGRLQICFYTLWVENFDEIALSHTVKEIEAICVLPFLAKIWKFPKMAAILGRGNFCQNCKEYKFASRYPVG